MGQVVQQKVLSDLRGIQFAVSDIRKEGIPCLFRDEGGLWLLLMPENSAATCWNQPQTIHNRCTETFCGRDGE